MRSDDVALGPTRGQLVHLAFIRIVSVNRGICAGQLGAKKAMARRQRVGWQGGGGGASLIRPVAAGRT